MLLNVPGSQVRILAALGRVGVGVGKVRDVRGVPRFAEVGDRVAGAGPRLGFQRRGRTQAAQCADGGRGGDAEAGPRRMERGSRLVTIAEAGGQTGPQYTSSPAVKRRQKGSGVNDVSRPVAAATAEARSTDRYLGGDSASKSLYERALSVMPGGNSRHTLVMDPYPIYAASGHGCIVTDGRRRPGAHRLRQQLHLADPRALAPRSHGSGRPGDRERHGVLAADRDGHPARRAAGGAHSLHRPGAVRELGQRGRAAGDPGGARRDGPQQRSRSSRAATTASTTTRRLPTVPGRRTGASRNGRRRRSSRAWRRASRRRSSRCRSTTSRSAAL